MVVVNPCSKCPREIRGKCCHLNIPLEGMNIILDNVHCPQLDPSTGKCKDYENRASYWWCLMGDDLYGHGSLPKGCLYLKKNPSLEPNPKIDIKEALSRLSNNKKHVIIGIYNYYNNIPFEEFLKHVIKNKKVEVRI